VDEKTVNKLADLAEEVYEQPGKTVESGIGQAMVAVLSSPRFLFREEETEGKAGAMAAILGGRILAGLAIVLFPLVNHAG
jgi:hypothetical protein